MTIREVLLKSFILQNRVPLQNNHNDSIKLPGPRSEYEGACWRETLIYDCALTSFFLSFSFA